MQRRTMKDPANTIIGLLFRTQADGLKELLHREGEHDEKTDGKRSVGEAHDQAYGWRGLLPVVQGLEEPVAEHGAEKDQAAHETQEF